MKIIFIFSCSGMFRDVPECSVFGVLSTPLWAFEKSVEGKPKKATSLVVIEHVLACMHL